MRPEPHPDLDARASSRARGFGAGVTPDPTLAIDHDDTGWTHYHVTTRSVTDYNVRCDNVVRLHGTDGLTKVCNALLAARVTRPWTLACRKCKHINAREVEE